MSRMDPDLRMKRLVRELLGGRSVYSLSRNEIPGVRAALEAKQEELGARSNKSQRLEELFRELDDVEHKKSRPKSRQATSKSNGSEPPRAVLESVMNDLLDGFPYEIAETYMLPHLILYAQEEVDRFIEQNDYINAQKREDIRVNLIGIMATRTEEGEKRDQREKVENMLDTTKTTYAQRSAELNQEMEELKEKCQKAVDDLIKERDQQLHDFDVATKGPIPPSYKKLSQRILNLRRTEEALVKLRKFNEAAEVQAEADRETAQELLNLEKQYKKTRAAQRATLVEQYAAKLAYLEDNNRLQIARLQTETDKELDCLSKSIGNRERKLERQPESPTLPPESPKTQRRSPFPTQPRSGRVSP